MRANANSRSGASALLRHASEGALEKSKELRGRIAEGNQGKHGPGGALELTLHRVPANHSCVKKIVHGTSGPAARQGGIFSLWRTPVLLFTSPSERGDLNITPDLARLSGN